MSGQVFGLIFSFLSNRWLQVVLDDKYSQEYLVNDGVPQGSILGPTLFLPDINDLPGDAAVILLSMRMILLSILSVIRHLIRGNNLNWLLNLNLIYETLWTGVRHLALFLLFSIIGSFELLWVENLHNNLQLMLEFLETSFLILHFSYHALTIFLKMLSLILLSMQMILLTIVLVIRHLICGNNLKLLVDFNAGKTQQVLLDQFNNNGSVDVNWMALFSRKNHLLRCWS